MGDDPWGSGATGHWDPEEELPIAGLGGIPGSGRAARDREREVLGEALEAVLLVEPFAMVSALEDYIWEKHGPKAPAGVDTPARASSSATMGGAGAGIASAACRAAGDASMAAALASEGGSTIATAASSAAPAAPGPPDTAAARVRLSVKQPPLGLLRTTSEGSEAAAAAAAQPQTPLAILDPGTPSAALAVAAAAPPEAAGNADMPFSGASAAAGASGAAIDGDSQRRVRIFLNGKLLPSKTSVVQALVKNASRLPHAVSGDGHGLGPSALAEERGQQSDRFLAVAEDSGSSPGNSSGPLAAGSHASPRHFCGAIWGRVHSMTYDIVTEESRSPRTGGSCASTANRAAAVHNVDSPPTASPTVAAATAPEPFAYVRSDFDALVQCHGRVASSLAMLQQQPAAAAPSACAAAETAEAPASLQEQLTPRSSSSKDDGDVGGCSGAPTDQEALATMLQLIAAFYNVCEYLRSSQGPLNAEFPIPEEEFFHCGSLTAALLRQLSDPLAVCTGSVPVWCTKLAGACRFLFPYSVRRILHHSCNLGLSRALHHVQQRALAQHAHSQETQRRLEGEVAVASIPRQKVRISRQRILESAVKVMNLYGSGNAILEVEYVGEVGTGSGPTLEFYAQVADILRSCEPPLFRQGVPGGMLFPAPRDPQWLRGEDQAAQQILERFRLLGQVVAKCILDGRLVDVQLHPLFWRSALNSAPFTERSLRDLDPELLASVSRLREMDDQALSQLCVDFTLPGHPGIELKPNGANVSLSIANLEDYIARVAEVSLVEAVAPQVQAFCTAFKELLPIDACSIWSEKELASIIVGASVRDDACWTLEHLSAHIKAQHGYSADSRCFRDLLVAMAEFQPEDRRRFLTFVTGAPSLPIGGFGGLKPPLTVVKKEAPPPPLTPDQFMPSVMTCANYLKLPEYSAAEHLRQKLELAMREGQSAFLLS